MGYIFENNEITIWSPSNKVAEIFLGQVSTLAELINCEAGLHEEMSSSIVVDSRQVLRCLSAADRYLQISNNRSLELLFQGVAVHLVVLCRRCGENDTDLEYLKKEWLEEATALQLTGMPT